MRVSPATGTRPAIRFGGRWIPGYRQLSVALIAVSATFGSLPRDASAGPGVQVALSPAGQTVNPGSDFYLDVMVTQPSQPYNTWQGTLEYDPDALTYLPSSAEQGCLMTGDCSNACGSTYLRVTPGPDSIYILNSIQCYQTFITSPGQLYHLHFRASTVQQQTTVTFKGLRFNDGIEYASPVTYSPALIGIGMPVTGVDPSTSATGLRLSSSPNPSNRAVTFAISSDNSGEQDLSVHDIQGRSVRVLASGWQPAGSHTQTWDGTDGSGHRVRPGVYLVTLRAGARRIQDRVTIVQ